jgi:hypothetical protein
MHKLQEPLLFFQYDSINVSNRISFMSCKLKSNVITKSQSWYLFALIKKSLFSVTNILSVVLFYGGLRIVK